MVRTSVSIFIFVVVTILIGCSGFDSTQIVLHPDAVKPSQTFEVVLVNLYSYCTSNSSMIPKTVERDSVHLLVGMPESWEVLDAAMAVVDDMKIKELLALQSNILDQVKMASLVQRYQDKVVALPVDDALIATLNGRTVSAHNQKATGNVDVVVDSIAVWKGFSAPVNIMLEEGSATDTILPIDSLEALVASSGVLPESDMDFIGTQLDNAAIIDSVGIIMIPIVLQLQIQTSSNNGSDTLYYFTKTGAMNQVPDPTIGLLMPAMADVEIGDMTYAPIQVSDKIEVISSRTTISASAITVTSNRLAGIVHIDFGGMNPAATSVGIYTLQGNLVTTLLPNVISPTLVWDGSDRSGSLVRSGAYIVRINSSNGNVVKPVQLVR